jgi:hypothetical protein
MFRIYYWKDTAFLVVQDLFKKKKIWAADILEYYGFISPAIFMLNFVTEFAIKKY